MPILSDYKQPLVVGPESPGHNEPVTQGPKPKGSPVALEDQIMPIHLRKKELKRVEGILKAFKAGIEKYTGDNQFKVAMDTVANGLQNSIAVRYALRLGRENLGSMFDNPNYRWKSDVTYGQVANAHAQLKDECHKWTDLAIEKGAGWLSGGNMFLNLLKEIGNFVLGNLGFKERFQLQKSDAEKLKNQAAGLFGEAPKPADEEPDQNYAPV